MYTFAPFTRDTRDSAWLAWAFWYELSEVHLADRATAFSFCRKARRKEKDAGTTEDPKLYLEEAALERQLPELDLRMLVDLPPGLDYNEWLASHTLALFDHINLVYGTISEFCTMTGCPDMTGPGLRYEFPCPDLRKSFQETSNSVFFNDTFIVDIHSTLSVIGTVSFCHGFYSLIYIIWSLLNAQSHCHRVSNKTLISFINTSLIEIIYVRHMHVMSFCIRNSQSICDDWFIVSECICGSTKRERKRGLRRHNI